MSGLNELNNNYYITNFWDTKHNKIIDDWEDTPYNKDDWDKYLKLRKSEEDPKCLRIYRGQNRNCCYVEDGITILSPSNYLVELSTNTSEDDPKKYNHLCYVLMIEYAGIKVLLGGDATIEAWEDMLKECGEKILKSHIFLAPHHGSQHYIYKDAFDIIEPQYVVVSVAEKTDYDYDYYRKIAKKGVLSTKHFGTIKFKLKDTGKYVKYLERNG